MIYNSIIKSHLDYGILAWGSSSNSNMKTIRKLQKRCACNLILRKHASHSDLIFGNLEILKFDDLLKLNATSFMYDFINNKLPVTFFPMFTPLSAPNRTKSVKLEKVNYKYLQQFPKVYLPKIWNDLCFEIKNSSSLNILKNKMKNNTIEKYKSFSCSKLNCYSCAL